MNFSPDAMRQDLQVHADLCGELLSLSTRENQMLRCADEFDSGLNDYWRKDLLHRLQVSLEALKTHRLAWQKLPASERAQHSEVSKIIRHAQDLAMKMIVLDRENEQALLRRGVVPARHLPSAPRENFSVAALYQRHRS